MATHEPTTVTHEAEAMKRLSRSINDVLELLYYDAKSKRVRCIDKEAVLAEALQEMDSALEAAEKLGLV